MQIGVTFRGIIVAAGIVDAKVTGHGVMDIFMENDDVAWTTYGIRIPYDTIGAARIGVDLDKILMRGGNVNGTVQIIYTDRPKSALRVKVGSIQNNNDGFDTPDAEYTLVNAHNGTAVEISVDNRALMARKVRFYNVDAASELYRHHCNFVQNFDSQSGNTLYPLQNLAT